MKLATCLLVAPLLAGCASAAGRPDAVPVHREVPRTPAAVAPALGTLALRNAGFEAPPRSPNYCADRWDCSVHADPSSFTFTVVSAQAAEGAQAMCVERVGREPWATISQGIHDTGTRGMTLRLSLSMRLDGVTGEGAGPWVVLQGPGGRTLKHDQKLRKSTQGWERATLEFEVPPTTEILEVGMTLEGPGRACIDDVRLEIVKKAR